MFSMPLGEGLELRLLEPRHAEEVFEAVDANRERLREWLPWVDHARSPNDTRGFLSMQMARLAHGEAMTAGVWVDGLFAGVVEGRLDSERSVMDLGYWLARSFEGRGVMTRACRELLRYAFEDLRYARVELRCATENQRSCAVAERLGMQLDGVLRSAMPLRDRRLDLRVYSLLAADWKARGA
ncbi:MAG: GNAT family N-acetyltransferase [Acidobacteria bacterium]|nr:GNAT family N-acetyltransferase [Acidobacteriota bacterium]